LLKAGYQFSPYISYEKIVKSQKIEYYQVLNASQQAWKTDTEDMSH